MVPPLHQHTLQLWISPHFQGQPLSVEKMCDCSCAVTFTANKVAVTNGAATILTGQRDKDSGLWRVPLGNTNSAQAAPENAVQNVYEQTSIQETFT
jgi:hypothetical protein